MKILLTNPGRRTYLVEYFLEIQERCEDCVVELIDPDHHCASFTVVSSDRRNVVSRISEGKERYIKEVMQCIVSKQIDAVIPLSDWDLEVLALNKKLIGSAGCKAVVSDKEVVDVCVDKWKTASFCRRNGFDYPESYFDKEEIPDGINALVEKEVMGSGSRGLRFLKSKEEAEDRKGVFWQKEIEGIEYGLDILNDLEGNPLVCTVKRKIRIRAGETDVAEVIVDKQLEDFGMQLGRRLRHIGNVDVDVVRNKSGRIFVLDLNPRFGGGYPFTHCSGRNYVSSLVSMLQGKSFSAFNEARGVKVTKGISIHICGA